MRPCMAQPTKSRGTILGQRYLHSIPGRPTQGGHTQASAVKSPHSAMSHAATQGGLHLVVVCNLQLLQHLLRGLVGGRLQLATTGQAA